MTADNRQHPIDIQTFSEIIRKGYVYVDKTDLVWLLQDYAKYIFLSRPRRFGKSLLSSTLHSYFSGEQELFEGHKIMQYEREWKQYPVTHINLSVTKGKKSANELQRSLVRYPTLSIKGADVYMTDGRTVMKVGVSFS